MSDLADVTHIAGTDLTISGHRQRQRCAWCGAVLIDNDLRNMAVMVEPGHEDDPVEPPAVYPAGRLVRVTGGGNMRVFAVLDDVDKIPEDCCANLDDEVTG